MGIQKDARFFLASRQKDAIEREAEVAAQKAALRPVLLRLYPEAGWKPLDHPYPFSVKERILPAAILEFISAGRTVEAEICHQMAGVNRTHGIKKTAVKEIEPVMVQSPINIKICDRRLSAVTAPGLKAIYIMMYSNIAQLAKKTFAAVSRHAEALPIHGKRFYLPRSTRSAVFGETQKSWQYQGMSKKILKVMSHAKMSLIV